MRRAVRQFTTLLVAAFVVACSDSPTDTLNPAPADTAHGPGLLLPWSEIKGNIAYVTGDKLIAIDAGKREVRTLRVAATNELFVDVSWTIYGNQIAVASLQSDQTTRILVVDAETGNVKSVIERATCPRFNDFGLTYLRGDTVYMGTARLVTLPQPVASCPTWADRSTFFVIALGNSNAALYRVATALPNPIQIVEPANGSWADPALNFFGTSLAYVFAGASPENQIWVANPDGTNRRQVAKGTRLFGLSWVGTELLGVSTVGVNGSYDTAGLFLINPGTGVVRKLVAHPVYAASSSFGVLLF